MRFVIAIGHKKILPQGKMIINSDLADTIAQKEVRFSDVGLVYHTSTQFVNTKFTRNRKKENDEVTFLMKAN